MSKFLGAGSDSKWFRLSSGFVLGGLTVIIALAAQAKWGRFYIGTSNASIELPKQPQATEVPLADAVKSQIAHLEASRVDAAQLVVLLTYSEYKQKNTNLDSSVSGAIAQLKARGDKTDLKSSSAKLKVGGREARMLKLSYKAGGQSILYGQLFIGEGKKLWQVVVGYPASNKAGAAMAQHVFNSVQFK